MILDVNSYKAVGKLNKKSVYKVQYTQKFFINFGRYQIFANFMGSELFNIILTYPEFGQGL